MAGRSPIVAACLLLAAAAASKAEQPVHPDGLQPVHPDGFWKVHPARAVKAEFDGEDPIGLSAHQHIPTDCSIAWKDNLHSKVYCFSSPISSLTFQDNPSSILPQADAFWNTDRSRRPDMLAGAKALN